MPDTQGIAQFSNFKHLYLFSKHTINQTVPSNEKLRPLIKGKKNSFKTTSKDGIRK